MDSVSIYLSHSLLFLSIYPYIFCVFLSIHILFFICLSVFWNLAPLIKLTLRADAQGLNPNTTAQGGSGEHNVGLRHHQVFSIWGNWVGARLAQGDGRDGGQDGGGWFASE